LTLKSTLTVTPIETPTQTTTASLSGDLATISFTTSLSISVGPATASYNPSLTWITDTATQTVSPSPTVTLTAGDASLTESSTLTDSFPSASIPLMTAASSSFSICRGMNCLPSTALIPQRVSVVTNKTYADATPSKSALGSKPLYVVSAADALTLDFVGSTNGGANDRVVLVNIATTSTSPFYKDVVRLSALPLVSAVSQIEQDICSTLEVYYNSTVAAPFSNSAAQRSVRHSYTQFIPYDAVELFASPFTPARWTTALTANGTSIIPAPLGVSGDRFVVCYRSYRYGSWHAVKSDVNGTFIVVRPDVIQSSRRILNNPSMVVGPQVQVTVLQRGVTRRLLECFYFNGDANVSSFMTVGTANASACWATTSTPPLSFYLKGVAADDVQSNVPPVLATCRDRSNTTGQILVSPYDLEFPVTIELFVSSDDNQVAPVSNGSTEGSSATLLLRWNITFSVSSSAWYTLCVVDNELQQIVLANLSTGTLGATIAAATLDGLAPLMLLPSSAVWQLGSAVLGDVSAVQYIKRAGLLFPLFPNTTASTASVASLVTLTVFDQSLLSTLLPLDEQLVARDANVTFGVSRGLGLSNNDTWRFVTVLGDNPCSAALDNSNSEGQTPSRQATEVVAAATTNQSASRITAASHVAVKVTFDQLPFSAPSWALCLIPAIASTATSTVTAAIWQTTQYVPDVWQTEPQWSNTTALLHASTAIDNGAAQQLKKTSTSSNNSSNHATWTVNPIFPTAALGPYRGTSLPSSLLFVVGTNVTVCLSGGRNINHADDVVYAVRSDEPCAASTTTLQVGARLSASPSDLAARSNCSAGGGSEGVRSFYFDSSALLTSPLETAATFVPSAASIALTLDASTLLPMHNSTVGLKLCFYSPTTAVVATSGSAIDAASLRLTRSIVNWTADVKGFTQQFFSGGFGLKVGPSAMVETVTSMTPVAWAVPLLSSLQWLNTSSTQNTVFLRMLPRSTLIDPCQYMDCSSTTISTIGETTNAVSTLLCAGGGNMSGIVTVSPILVNATHAIFSAERLVHGYGVVCWNFSESSAKGTTRFLASPWATFTPYSPLGFAQQLWPGAGPLPAAKSVALNRFDFDSTNVVLVGIIGSSSFLHSRDMLVPCVNATPTPVQGTLPEPFFNVTVVNNTAIELQRSSVTYDALHLCLLPGLHVFAADGVAHSSPPPLKPWATLTFLPAVISSVATPSAFTTIRGSVTITIDDFVGYSWMISNSTASAKSSLPLNATLVPCYDQPNSGSAVDTQRSVVNTSAFTVISAASASSAGSLNQSGGFGSWTVTFTASPAPSGTVSLCLFVPDARMPSFSSAVAAGSLVPSSVAALQQDRLFHAGDVTVDPLLQSAAPLESVCDVVTNFTVYGAGSVGAAGLIFVALDRSSSSSPARPISLFTSGLANATLACAAAGALLQPQPFRSNATIGIYTTNSFVAATSASSLSNRTFLLPRGTISHRGFYGLCYLGPSGDVYSFETPVVIRVLPVASVASVPDVALRIYGAVVGNQTSTSVSSVDGTVGTVVRSVVKIFSGVATPFSIYGGGLDPLLDTIYIVPLTQPCLLANLVDTTGYGAWTVFSANSTSFFLSTTTTGLVEYRATLAPNSDAFLYAICVQQTGVPSPSTAGGGATYTSITTRVPLTSSLDAIAVKPSLFLDSMTSERQGAFVMSGPALRDISTVRFSFAYNQQSAQILLGATPTLAFGSTTAFSSSISTTSLSSSSNVSTASGLFAVAFPPVVPIPSSSAVGNSSGTSSSSYNVTIIADISYTTAALTTTRRFAIPVSVEQDAALRRLMNSTWNTASLCANLPQNFDELTNVLPSWRRTKQTKAGASFVGFPVVSGPPNALVVNNASLLAASLDYSWQLTTATILARHYLYFNCSAATSSQASSSSSSSPDFLISVMQDVVLSYPALATDPVTIFTIISEILVDKVTRIIATASTTSTATNRSQVVSQFNSAVSAASGIIASTKTTLSTQFGLLTTSAAQAQLVTAHEAVVASVLDLIAATPSTTISDGSSVALSSTTQLGLQAVGRVAQLVTAMCSSSSGSSSLLPLASTLGSLGALSVSTRSPDAPKSLSGSGSGISISLPPLSAIDSSSENVSVSSNQTTASQNDTQCVAMFPITIPTTIGRETSSIASTASTSATTGRQFSVLAESASSSVMSQLPELNMPLLSFMLAGGTSSITFLTSPAAYVDVQFQVPSIALNAAWATITGSAVQGGIGRPKHINMTLDAYRFLVNASSLTSGDLSGYWVSDPISSNITNTFSDATGSLAYRLFYNNMTPTSNYEALLVASPQSQGLVIVGGRYELLPFFDRRFDVDLSVAAVFACLIGASLLIWLVVLGIACHRCCGCLLGVRRGAAPQAPRSSKLELHRNNEAQSDRVPTAYENTDDDGGDPFFIGAKGRHLGTIKAVDDNDEDAKSWHSDKVGRDAQVGNHSTSTLPSIIADESGERTNSDLNHSSSRNHERLTITVGQVSNVPDSLHAPSRRQQPHLPLPARRLPPTAAAANMQPYDAEHDVHADWDRASSTTAGSSSANAAFGDDFAMVPWVTEANDELAGFSSATSTNADDFLSISVGGAEPPAAATRGILFGSRPPLRDAAELGSVASTPSGFEDPDRTPQTPTPTTQQPVHGEEHFARVGAFGEGFLVPQQFDRTAEYYYPIDLVEELSAGSSFRTVSSSARRDHDDTANTFAATGAGTVAVAPQPQSAAVVNVSLTPQPITLSRVERKQKRLADERLKAALARSRKRQRDEKRQEKILQQYEIDRAEGIRLLESDERLREQMIQRTQLSLRWRVLYLLQRLHWIFVTASCASSTLAAAALPLGARGDEEEHHLVIRRRSPRERCTVVLSILQRLMILSYTVLVVMLFCGTYEHSPVMVIVYGLMAAALANPVATVATHLLLRTTIHSYHRLRDDVRTVGNITASVPPFAPTATIITAVQDAEERMRKRFPFSRFLSSLCVSSISILLALGTASFTNWITKGEPLFVLESAATNDDANDIAVWEYPPIFALILLVPGYVATVLVTSFVSACIDFFTTSVVEDEPAEEGGQEINESTHKTAQSIATEPHSSESSSAIISAAKNNNHNHHVIRVTQRRSKRTYLAGFLAVFLHAALILAAGYSALHRTYLTEGVPVAWRQSPRVYTWHQSLVVAIVLDIFIVDPIFLLVSYSADLLMLRVFFTCVERVVVGFYRLRLSLRRALARKAPTVQPQEPFAEEIIFGPSSTATGSRPLPPTAAAGRHYTDDDVEDERGNSNEGRRRAHERYLHDESASRKPQIHAKERARVEELRRTRRAIFGINEIFGDSDSDADGDDDLFVQFDDEASPRRASSTSRAAPQDSRRRRHHVESHEFDLYNNSEQQQQQQQRSSSPRFDDVYKPPTHYDLGGRGRRHDPFGHQSSSDEEHYDVFGERFDAASMRSSEGGLFEPISPNDNAHQSQIGVDSPHEVDEEKRIDPIPAAAIHEDYGAAANDDDADRWVLVESLLKGGESAASDNADGSAPQQGETYDDHEALVDAAPVLLVETDVMSSSDRSSDDVDIVFEEEQPLPSSSAPILAAAAENVQPAVVNHGPMSPGSIAAAGIVPSRLSDHHSVAASAASPSSSSRGSVMTHQRVKQPRGPFESDPFDLYASTSVASQQKGLSRPNPPKSGPRHALTRVAVVNPRLDAEMERPTATATTHAQRPPLPPPPSKLPPRALRRQGLLRATAGATDTLHHDGGVAELPRQTDSLVDTVSAPTDIASALPQPVAADPQFPTHPPRDVSPVPSELYHDLARYALDSPSSQSFRVTSEVPRDGGGTARRQETQGAEVLVGDGPMMEDGGFGSPSVVAVATRGSPLQRQTERTESEKDFDEVADDLSQASAETIIVDLAIPPQATDVLPLDGVEEADNDDGFAEVPSDANDDEFAPIDRLDEPTSDDDNNFFDPVMTNDNTKPKETNRSSSGAVDDEEDFDEID
jgi:hypothetical protein